MATQQESISYPVCDHQFDGNNMVAQNPLDILSGLRSYISEFECSGGSEVFAFSSQGIPMDSMTINSSEVKASIREPFKDAQIKMGQSFNFSSQDVYVVTAKKDGQVILPVYMDSSSIADILEKNGFCYENSNGFTSLCTFEDRSQTINRLEKVGGLAVNAIQTEEGYWLFLAPVPSQFKRQ